MSVEDDWAPHTRRPGAVLGNAGMGALRVTLLFGSAAIALALVLTPIMDQRTRAGLARAGGAGGIDFTTTGSTPGGEGRTYTLRRSVLQSSPESVCVISAAGTMHGEC